MHIDLLMRPTYVDGNDVDVNRFKGEVSAEPGEAAYWSKAGLTWKRGHF